MQVLKNSRTTQCVKFSKYSTETVYKNVIELKGFGSFAFGRGTAIPPAIINNNGSLKANLDALAL